MCFKITLKKEKEYWKHCVSNNLLSETLRLTQILGGVYIGITFER